MTNKDRELVANEARQLADIHEYSYDKYVEFMLTLIEHHPFSYFSIAKGTRFNALWKDILSKTAFLDEHFKPKAVTRIYYYINKLSALKTCETCGKELVKDISPVNHSEHFFCCNRCAQLHESTIAKTKATKLKNHGDPNWNNMDKTRSTCMERYGTECSWQAEEVKEKCKETLRSKYGVDHQMRSQEVKDKMRAHYKEQHGVEYSFQDAAVKQKINNTKRERRMQHDAMKHETDRRIVIYPEDVLKSKLLEVIEKYPASFSRIVKSPNYDISLFESLKHWCPAVADDEYSVQTKIYWFMNGIKDFPVCSNKTCGKSFEHKNVINWKVGYRKNCCPQCAKESDERKELYMKTCQKKWGVSNASQAQEVKDKKSESALAKYGVDNVAKAPEVQEKIQQTNLERYGATTYLHSVDGIKKTQASCLDRYGTTSYSKTCEYIEKCKATNRTNYKTDWPHQNREFMRNLQKRYTYNGMNFDSKPELAYYIWLVDNNVEFTYQPDISFEYEHDGVKHMYEPDFIVEGQAVELKGDHFFKDDGTMQNPFDHNQDAVYEAKHQCMLENNVKIMRSDEYSRYLDYVEKKHGKDWLNSFKHH